MSDRYSPPESTPSSQAEKVVAEIRRRLDEKYHLAEAEGYREIGFTTADDFLKARDPEYVLFKALLEAGDQ